MGLPEIHAIVSVEPKLLFVSSPSIIFDLDVSIDFVKSGHSIAVKQKIEWDNG